MCLIAFAINEHEQYPFVLIANRDEFYDRPTEPAHHWPAQKIIAGKDLKAGGTWMGVSTEGRFAAVTNFRDPKNINPNANSRGELPTNYLGAKISPTSFLDQVDRQAKLYNGFNLLLSDLKKVWHYSNYENKVNVLENGIHGLSNALLNSPWPKVEKVKSELANMLNSDFTLDDLFSILSDRDLADNEKLPKTGVPPDWEKALSAVCISTEKYGTCSSSVLLLDQNGDLTFEERTLPVAQKNADRATFKLKIA